MYSKGATRKQVEADLQHLGALDAAGVPVPKNLNRDVEDLRAERRREERVRAPLSEAAKQAMAERYAGVARAAGAMLPPGTATVLAPGETFERRTQSTNTTRPSPIERYADVARTERAVSPFGTIAMPESGAQAPLSEEAKQALSDWYVEVGRAAGAAPPSETAITPAVGEMLERRAQS